jgi:hypothetical protein
MTVKMQEASLRSTKHEVRGAKVPRDKKEKPGVSGYKYMFESKREDWSRNREGTIRIRLRQ